MGKKSIARNYIYNMVYQVLILVLPLITTPYLSRVLGAEGIGIYSYTYAIVTYFILFGSLGVALYGQREIAYAQDNVEARGKTFFEILIFRFVTIFISIILYFFLFMNGEKYQLYYRILLLELVAAAFDISWFFQGIEEFKRTVTRNVLVRICSVTLVFMFVKTREDLARFTLIYSLADLIGNLSLWLYLPKYMKGVTIKNIDVVQHIPQIVLLFIPQIANQIYKILDTTMIGKIVDDKTETGFYEQGQKVIRLLLTIVTSLGVVMIPRMANTFASGDKKKINEYLKMSFKFVFFLSFPLMFGISVIANNFVPVFFGAGYDKVVVLIRIICPIILLMGVGNVVGTQYLLPTKRQKEYTISVTIGLIVNFILNYILITNFKSIGASIATVLSELVVIAVQLRYIKDDFDVRSLFELSYKYVVASGIMFLVCIISKGAMNLGAITNGVENIGNKLDISFEFMFNICSIVVQVLLGMITYFVTLIILKDDSIIKLIDKIKSVLHIRKDATL